MATKYPDWETFRHNCLQADRYNNGEVTVDTNAGPIHWVSEDGKLRVQPKNSTPSELVTIFSGETINPAFYYKNLAEQLAKWQKRVQLEPFPNQAATLDQATTIVRERIQDLLQQTDLPTRILSQSLGGYILSRLTFHDTVLNTKQIKSLHFDAPALTGKIYTREDAIRFAKDCLIAKDRALLSKGNRLSIKGYQQIFEVTREVATILASQGQRTSGLIPELAVRGLSGANTEVTNIPEQPISIHARIDDKAVNFQLLQQRSNTIRVLGAKIELISETGGHLNLPNMSADQTTETFAELFY